MSLSNLLTPLSILISFWLLTHLVLRLFLPHLPRVSLSYQPPPFSSSHLLLTESSLFVCFRITHLNAQADRLAVWFVRRGRRAAAQAVYALGGMLAAGGVLAAVVVLGWMAFRLAGAASARWTPHDDLAKVWKREEPEALASVSAHERPGHGIPVYAIVSFSEPISLPIARSLYMSTPLEGYILIQTFLLPCSTRSMCRGIPVEYHPPNISYSRYLV